MIPIGARLKGATLSKKYLPNPRRGEVWNVNSDPTIGSEIQKIRPITNARIPGTLIKHILFSTVYTISLE